MIPHKRPFLYPYSGDQGNGSEIHSRVIWEMLTNPGPASIQIFVQDVVWIHHS